MFCTQCGSQNAPEAKFCTTCGSPLAAVPEDATVAEVPSPQAVGQDGGAVPPVPLPGGGTLPGAQPAPQSVPQPGPAGSGAPSGNDGGANAKALNRKLIIGIAIAAVVLVAAVAAGIVTYSMELWGGKSLPDVTVVSPKDSSKAADAKVVVKQLENKGFKVKRVKEFSGVGKGKFLGYRGADSGMRVKSGSTVTVCESLGPGVPDGTVGKKAERVVKTFSDMGVPVRYKKVLVSDSSKTAEGSVVSTYPVQGQPVKDDKNGIYIGVATKSDDGLPSDIVGQDVSKVKSDLESKGYDVKVEKRLASKKNVGKVSSSEPGPGSQLKEGQTVTLYQGVDAKGAKQSYMREFSDDHNELSGLSDIASGQWCTKSGDCITLGADEQGAIQSDSFKVTDGGADTKYSMTGEGLVSCDALQQPFCSSQKADYLLTGDSGSFELFPHRALSGYWCGDSFINTNSVASQKCVAGSVQDIDDSFDYKVDGSGKYRMMDMFAVFPVGSDVQSVEDDGYFDASALATAKKQKAVDTDRPFLMYRDANQYKDREKEKAVTTASDSFNPFLPFAGYSGSKSDIIRMRPAPSDETAYYLVENTQPDWDSLEDANVKGVSDKSGKSGNTAKTDSSSKKTSPKNWKSMTSDEISAAVGNGDFSSIAGKYCQKSGTSCLTLDDQGIITASGQQDLYLSPDDGNRSTLHVVDSSDGWKVPSDIGIEMRGPDSDYRCGSQRGEAACYAPSAVYSEAEITKPANIIYVFKDADPEQVKELAAGVPDSDYVQPDSSKPFLKILSYHMNASPSDQNVFYPVE